MDNPCTTTLQVKEVSPGQETKRTRGKKRPLSVLSPSSSSPLRKKIKISSEHDLNSDAEGTVKNLNQDKPPTGPSSTVLNLRTAKTSADKLLRRLGHFLCRRCSQLKDLSPADPETWLRNIDLSLLLSGREDHCFITPGTTVFLYMLCQDMVSADVATVDELQAILFSCFYLSYAYAGEETGYPAKPFMVKENRTDFWSRTLNIANAMSAKMLQINTDSQYFDQVLADLKKQKKHGRRQQGK